MVLFKEIYVVLLFPCAQIDLILGAKNINYPMWPIVLGQLNLQRKIRHSSTCWNYPKLDTRRGAYKSRPIS